MAVDKLVDSSQLNSDLTSVANAIRTKGGTSAQLAFPSGFVSAIGDIPTGGGGGISLIDTITVSSNTRALNLDMTEYSSYDFVLVIFDTVEVGPSADWLYFVHNGSEPSGGTYTNSSSTFQGVAILWTKFVESSNAMCILPSASGVTAPNVQSTGLSNVYIYTYTSSKYIVAGSTIKIYGGNYADL